MKKIYSLLIALMLYSTTTFATGHIVTPTIIKHVNCAGGSDGKAYVTVTGGVGPFTYSWNSTPLQTSDTLFNAPAGTYICTVTDQSDMSTATASVTITQPQQQILSLSTNPAHCHFSDGTIDILITGGTTPHTILLNDSNGSISGFVVPAGSYTISVTDANGCQVSGTAIVNDIAGPTAQIIDSTMITCNGANNGSALASVVGGTLPYQAMGWQETSQAGYTATNLPPGIATFIVYDAAGCIGSDAVDIIQPSDIVTLVPSYVNPRCFNYYDGSAVVLVGGGTYGNAAFDNNYSYTVNMYNNPSQTLTCTPGSSIYFAGLGVFIGTSNTYTVMVTDSRGCTDSTTVTITQPDPLIISNPITTTVSCFGANDGAINVNVIGGTPFYTYNWTSTAIGFADPGTPNLTNLIAGSYTLSVVDSKGCTDNQLAFVTEPTPLNNYVATTPPTSAANCDGSASANPSGGTPPYTYIWTNSSSTVIGSGQSISNLCVGIYSLSISDAHGCGMDTIYTIDVTPVGIKEIKSNIAANIFPNPANNEVEVQIVFAQQTKAQLKIKTILGETLDVIEFGNSNEIKYLYNTAQLANGTYFFEIVSEKTSLIKKISVLH